MNKFKSLVFIAVMLAATLLAIGSLTTPAQANRADIDIGTPTPTGTPITDPNGQGEPVPEQLKAVIQAYFEIRYSALSSSQPNGFQLDGFGDLVSDEADARTFLDAELGKLAVERKHAELNHLKYAEYKYFLDFRDSVVDASGQMATVSVIEDKEVIYELSKELTLEEPIVSRGANLEHTIILRKQQDQWRIVSDHYNDYLWRMLRRTGKSTEEMLNILNTVEVPPAPAQRSESAEILTVSPLPADTSIHAYDRLGAVNYALDHWGGVGFPYNPDYPNYDGQILGGDCTNFISQAIYEGGNASMFIPSPLLPPGLGGQSGWFLLNEGQRASAWNDVGAFHTFVTSPSESWQDPYPGGEWYGEGPTGYAVSINELMIGDVIQYEDGGDATWDHAVIVTEINNGIPYVASHSENFDKVPYTNFDYWMNDLDHIRFIHIERSNGYSPVKTEIQQQGSVGQSSDDAGTNPSGCVFSATDNEVYLAACFNSGNITSGFRFNNIQIPKNTPIKYAYMNFTVDGTYTVPLNLQIYGENTGNSVTFSATSQPTQRVTFLTPVPWDITNTWNSGVRENSPLLTSFVQSIINHPNWVSGNSLSVIIKNNGATSGNPWPVRRVMAYERLYSHPTLSPTRLIVAYGLTTTSSLVPIPNSLAAQDGYVVESAENSSIGGGSPNSTNTSFIVGDATLNRQYRGILHFNTVNLPDTAVITSAILKIKQQGAIVGTNPFTTHGGLMVDIQKPSFGTTTLQIGDFQATAGQIGAATFDSTPLSSWYSAILNSTGFPYVNLTGTTQFRLYFTLDDNDDGGADYMAFSSGNNATVANRPQLIINYYVP